MKLRPTIFLSSVSSEFASFRDAAEIEIQKKGCFPLNEPSFGVDYREIEDLLRRHLSEADAMIHIVGFRYGSEPKGRPADKPRRSYTQMEYDIARELNIPVYVFLSADANVRDPYPGEQPEDAEAIQLQLSYRQFLQSSNNIRYSFNSKNHLGMLVAGIPLFATADFRVDISRILEYAPAELIGREEELALLTMLGLKSAAPSLDAHTFSRSSRLAAKARLLSSLNGQQNSLIRSGPAATQLLHGRSTARARVNKGCFFRPVPERSDHLLR